MTKAKNIKQLQNKLRMKARDFNSSFLEKIAEEVRSHIQLRTQNKGEGLNKKSLKGYSAGYAAFRQEKGRQIFHRDLTFTGRMFQSMTSVRIADDKVKIFFSSKAEADKAASNNKRSPFFGLGTEENRIINKRLKEFGKL